ncbi:MAG: sugar ABC transporter substrate-binding protein [Eubacteriales bacterium]|nr:sugar ABC transporter substrate-binding protein [Eubacteriales bacterium]
MKKMRLVTVLAVAAAMVISLAACGGGSGASSSSSGSDAGAASGGDSINVTLIMAQRDEFLSTLESGAKDAAAEKGVNLQTQDANSDTGKMIQFIETAKNNGNAAVIINMVDPETAQSCIDAAGDMKVVFVNRVPSDTSVLTDSAVYVGSDEHDSGRFQGEALADYFKAKGQTDIKYVLLNGILGQTSTTLRTESVLKALADNGINATEATAPINGKYDRAEAQNKVATVLSAGTAFDCIISNNDAMAIGAIEACNDAGKTIDFPIVGIDATADGCQAVVDGTMYMTVFQNAKGQGAGSVQAAINLVNGAALNEGTDFEVDAETGHILWVPFEPVNADNVANYQ